MLRRSTIPSSLFIHYRVHVCPSARLHKPLLGAEGMASNITLQQYHKRIQLWCLFQLTQIDHNYPYISYYPTKKPLDIDTGGEKANFSNRMHNPEYPYTHTDYFPYAFEESKQPSCDVLKQDADACNTYADLPYHLSSQASRMLTIESSAPGYKATLNNTRFSEEAKEHTKEQIEHMGEMKQ